MCGRAAADNLGRAGAGRCEQVALVQQHAMIAREHCPHWIPCAAPLHQQADDLATQRRQKTTPWGVVRRPARTDTRGKVTPDTGMCSLQPLTRTQSTVTHPEPEPPRVVVVSDADGFAHLLRTLLDDLGLKVRNRRLSEDTLWSLDDFHPDLVILDLVPGTEERSWRTLEALQTHNSPSAIPVLLCPAAPWLLHGHADRIAQYGALTWCDGFDLHDLLAKIQSALGSRLAGDPARQV